MELIVLLMLIPLYGFLATYFCHPLTTLEITSNANLAYLVVVFSSYSLVGQPIPENTPYGTDDSFSFVSHHYQRIIYQIVIFAIAICLD